MSDLELLHQATEALLTVGRERNYRSDTFWNAVYALTIVQRGLVTGGQAK